MSPETLSRRTFLQGTAAVGGAVAIGGPLAALTAGSAHGKRRAVGYGPLAPAAEEDTGVAHLLLPAGFRYRVISREGDPSTAWITDPETGEVVRTTVPTPGIFDGTGAFPGPNNTTILIRNHENRQRAGELPVVVPDGARYNPSPSFRAGNTRLVVGRDRRVEETTHVLGGTSTNCAGGVTPWGSWITCEETFIAPTATSPKHGYCFEIDAYADGPVTAVPIKAAGCFAHEAVVYLDGVLYETEDNGKPSGFYRYLPSPTPRRAGDLAASSGPLQAIKRKGVPQFDADRATVDETFEVEWVTIPDPDPATNSVRQQGLAAGMISFSRLEGCWLGEGRVYFAATSGGRAGLGQVWEFDPSAQTLRLVYESTDAAVLQSPDNLVYMPHTGDLWVQEDGAGGQFVRGVTQDGRIYDVAGTLLNDSEFCGGCFSPDGSTFFVSQQGDRGLAGAPREDLDAAGALTYAIWGPFAQRRAS